ncbi:hypothetical protein EDB89DRAFT_1927765 [Lactarius sanguifluus]|nr:hypothetical protein EDB89DRAFT_1927765 [Lactarius sanguifluus]
MARKHSQSSPSPGPSTKALRTASPLAYIEPMVVDPSEPMVAPTGTDLITDELSSFAKALTSLIGWRKDDDFSSDATLSVTYAAILLNLESRRGDLVDFGQFKENATKMSASSFTELLRKAIKNPNDLEFWRPVVTHGTSPDLWWTSLSMLLISQFLDIFYIVMPDDPTSSEETRVKEANLTRSHL